MQINRDAITAQWIVTFAAMRRGFERTEVAWMTAVIEDHLLVKLAQGIVHHRSAQNRARLAKRGDQRLHLGMRIVKCERGARR